MSHIIGLNISLFSRWLTMLINTASVLCLQKQSYGQFSTSQCKRYQTQICYNYKTWLGSILTMYPANESGKKEIETTISTCIYIY